MNWIMLDAAEVDATGQVVLRDGRAVHILRVLRAVRGQRVRVGILDGRRGSAEIVALAEGAVTLACDCRDEPPREPSLDLLLALPRPKVLKRLWSPLAQLGVRRIILTNAEQVERAYFDTHWLAPEHYRPLLVEGLAQCGDTRLPQVQVVRRLKPYVEDVLGPAGTAGRWVAHPGPESARWPTLGPAGGLLAVGPEGGWSGYEMSMFDAHGFVTVTLGPRVLRADVACVAALAVLQASGRPPASSS